MEKNKVAGIKSKQYKKPYLPKKYILKKLEDEYDECNQDLNQVNEYINLIDKEDEEELYEKTAILKYLIELVENDK